MMCFFFFNDTATTEIYTLSLHDALPIFLVQLVGVVLQQEVGEVVDAAQGLLEVVGGDVGEVVQLLVALVQLLVADLQRSEEHTSELQSRQYLVCRLLLEKKKNKDIYTRQ